MSFFVLVFLWTMKSFASNSLIHVFLFTCLMATTGVMCEILRGFNIQSRDICRIERANQLALARPVLLDHLDLDGGQ